MTIRSGGKAPYGPPGPARDLIHAFRNRGLQTPFTAEVLARAGVKETLIPRTLQTFRLLGLIDENGNPTAEFEGLRRAAEAEYPQRLEAVIRNAYAEVFQYVDPATDDEAKIKDAFRAYEPLGQLSRMVTLFLGLCAEARILPEGKQKPSRSPSSRTVRLTKPKSPTRHHDPETQYLRSGPRHRAVGALPPAIAGLLDALPPNGQGWTKAQREKFIATFMTVLDFSIPIREEVAADESNEEE